MKKIEVLTWGMNHIAQNHGLNAGCDYEEDGQVCIWGGCNIPTLADVKMLCEDLKMNAEQIEADAFGITVYLDGWLELHGEEEYKVTGVERWKKYAAVIGE